MTLIRRRVPGALLALTLVGLTIAPPALAADRPALGDAEDYAVIADQAVTSAGATAITGNVGIAASSSLSGFPPGTIDGEVHLADSDALAAAGASTSAGVDLRSQPCESDRSGEDQGGLRLAEGVYCYTEPTALGGELRLDALGVADAVWVFQIDAAYDVAAGSRVILANGAQPCNVFWRVDGAMTVGAGAALTGTYITEGDIVLGDETSLNGRVFAPRGSISLTSTTITQAACTSSTSQVTTTTTTAAPPADDATTTTTAAPPVAGGDPSTPGAGSGGTTTNGSGDGSGGLAVTGPVSISPAVLAAAALGLGHALLGTERLARWNARRWRPRHALSRRARWTQHRRARR